MADNMGVATEKFETIYNLIIQEILSELPETKIMLMGPYVLEGKGICNCDEYPNRWEFMRDGVAEKAAATKRVAEAFGLVYVPLQEAFDDALKLAPVEHWVYEGVHPTAAGHEVIKRQWLKGFNMLKEEETR